MSEPRCRDEKGKGILEESPETPKREQRIKISRNKDLALIRPILYDHTQPLDPRYLIIGRLGNDSEKTLETRTIGVLAYFLIPRNPVIK